MRKTKEKTSSLIKKNNLIKTLKRKGLRSNSESIKFLIEHIELYTNNLLEQIEEKLTIKGRKTLKKENIKEIIEKQNEKNYPEI